jgi:hypothetical protein
MRADDYELAVYRPEFRAEVVALATAATRADIDLTSSYIRWKYEANPYLLDPLIYVARHQDRVVAMRGVYGSLWRAGTDGQARVLPCFGDLVVAQEHRSHGLVSELMDYALRDLAKRGFTHACSFSAGRIAIVGSMATGWKAIGSSRPMIVRSGVGALKGYARRHARLVSIHARVASLRPAPRSRLRTASSGGAFTALDRVNAAKSRRTPSCTSAEARPREMAALVARLPSDKRLEQVRTEEYLSWRLRDPRFDYRVLYWEEERLEGYLVLGALDRRWSRDVRILDWQGPPPVRDALLRAALAHGRFQKLAIWSISLSPDERSTLGRLGFQPDDQPSWTSSILVRPVGDITSSAWLLEGTDLREAENWNLTMMASDAF